MPRPPLLIESWLPIEQIGVESMRERGAPSALPPNYYLHVWWARRPLTASRAAILASVLPNWSEDWPDDLKSRFVSEAMYQQWFLELCGIFSNPVKARKLLDWAKQQGTSIPNPYTHDRAFKVNPSKDDIETMGNLLEFTWGTRKLSVLDPFAGGGSIPFEALRFGFTSIANELNPVAATILKATLDYPARFGPSLADDIRKWGGRWYELVKEKLEAFFTPLPLNAEGAAYLWARTVACPTTGKPVPLSPNWWLSKGSEPVGIELQAEEWMNEPNFRILKGEQVKVLNLDAGTVSRGVGRSPWTGETISGDYIKAEAQAGRMGQMLYSVANKVSGGFDFRVPTDEDKEKILLADYTMQSSLHEWIVKGIIPGESIPEGVKTMEPIRYGISRWTDMFSPRQLLVLAELIESLQTIIGEIRNQVDERDKSNAIITYLSFAISKILNYNSRLSIWHTGRRTIVGLFNRHDFGFAWSHTEFDASANLLPWGINQVAKAYKELAELAAPAQTSFYEVSNIRAVEDLSIQLNSASNLGYLKDSSIENITLDPPYYDNVQYAELSDFFYVWLKICLKDVFPKFYKDELTNKDDEAVANPARFEGMGRKKKNLAEQDYERKMAAAFLEMHRVLHPDGCLTVMFTHKKVEAWDTLASALIGAGFTVKASWPVHTESEHSLHQAKKNAAASTILLACRKREQQDGGVPVWWDDLQGKVRETARQKAEEFAEMGISGVDLYISTFGPTLSIISQHWPVLTSEVDPKTGKPRLLRPEAALDLAREEVIRLRKQGLLLGREVQFDQPTDWYLMAWDAFGAEQFPYDEARKLAIAMGVDLDNFVMKVKRLARKKGQYIILQKPDERRKKDMVDDEATSFEHWVDAAHTAMMIYQEDGAGPCEVFLRKSGLRNDGTFKACLQAMINAIPRTRIKGKFVRPEAEVLENMRLAFFDDLEAPVEVEPLTPEGVQIGMWEGETKPNEGNE